MAKISVNTAALKEKLSAKAEKKVNKNDVDLYVDKVAIGGGSKPTEASMTDLASMFIEIFKSEVYSSVDSMSASEDIAALSMGSPRKIGKNRYGISVSHSGSLSRASLFDPKYGYTGGGIDDIVELFNEGYSASKRVFGMWDGHGFGVVGSRQDRPGLGFIEAAISNFIAYSAGTPYKNVSVTVS